MPAPAVVAHRGSSHDVAEHTLDAYLRAIEEGADALECDVRLTADGHLVCVHDRRVNRTSNGSGVVSALELAHLEGLDWASWKMVSRTLSPGGDERPDRDAGRLLTLRRLLDAVRDCGRPVQLAIETKHPTRYAGLVEQRLCEVLDEYGWCYPRGSATSPVRVMSFSPKALKRMRRLAPRLPLVLLVRDRLPKKYRDGALPKGVRGLGLDVRLLRKHPGLAQSLHEHGHQLHCWTVDQDDEVARCLDADVDAIITNRPARVLHLLGRGGGTGDRPVRTPA